ncbi:LuxR C-terminal-related transcriptional regulator [Streptomyces sp. NPDC057963]|uniref:helix-turn-helix transcriptional regulator n=1 Tax=Streptomyces sp. NPDC057963 TaxID=3346290 RepID=UPI0036E5B53A
MNRAVGRADSMLTPESRGLPVVQATVLAAKAEILTRKGEFDEAAPTARTALTLPAAQPDGIRSFTRSERRVASLAAAGYTNREIALKLYVTPSTVEQHLTRVFRKLSVKRREELPVELCTDLLLR